MARNMSVGQPASKQPGRPAALVATVSAKVRMMSIEDFKRDRSVLLVYYSTRSRDRLEAMLRSQGAEVCAIFGRELDAAERVRTHPEDVIVIDKDVTDISVSQAARRMGQILPSTLVFAVGSDLQVVEVYKRGRRVGTIDFHEIAHFTWPRPAQSSFP